MRRRLRQSLAALSAALIATTSAAAGPTGDFVALLDKQSSFGDSKKSVVYYDTNDMSSPLFAIQSPFEDNVDEPDSLAVDPATGNTYLAAFDSGDPSSTSTTVTGATDTDGDMDLYRTNFAAAYNDWTNNQNNQYTTYVGQQVGSTPVSASGNANPKYLPGSVDKVGEVARAQGSGFYDTQLDYVNDNRLVFVDNNEQTSSESNNNVEQKVDNHQVRVLDRVSTSPGNATNSTDANGFHEGGYNNGTSESWESTILGRLNMDRDQSGNFQNFSEPERIAYYKDKSTGVAGIWVGESDGGSTIPNDNGTPGDPSDDFTVGDDVAFYEIGEWTGDDSGQNGLREFAIGSGPDHPNDFILDDNPVQDASSNDGSHSGIHVDKDGNLVIVESGFFDDPGEFSAADAPSFITRAISSYDDGNGRIAPGGWSYTQMDLGGKDAGPPLDDDNDYSDDRWTAYDAVNNDIYLFDTDDDFESNSGSPDFGHDWYRIDLDTGQTELLAFDADLSNGMFGHGDQVEFFSLDPALIAGDLDGDGQVSQADLDLVLQNWGDSSVPGGWLADFDDQVSQNELDAVLQNWGDGVVGLQSAPEPTSLALLGLGSVTLLGRRRRDAGAV